MANPTATWPLITVTPTPSPVPPTVPTPVEATAIDLGLLGRGVVRPFIRNGRGDFNVQTGRALIQAAVGQVLCTRCASETTQGEIAWRTDFGSLLYQLKHQPNTEATDEIARVYVVDALGLWEPRIRVTGVTVGRDPQASSEGENSLVIKVRYILRDSASNQVLLDNLVTTVTV